MQGHEIVSSCRQVLATMLNVLNVVSLEQGVLSDKGAASANCQMSALERIMVCTVASIQ